MKPFDKVKTIILKSSLTSQVLDLFFNYNEFESFMTIKNLFNH